MHSTRKLFATTMIAAAGAVTAALALSATAAAQPAAPAPTPGVPGLPFIQQLASNPAAATQLMQGFTSLMNTTATPAAATPATPPPAATASITLPQTPPGLPAAAAPVSTAAAPATNPADLLTQAASPLSSLASLMPAGHAVGRPPARSFDGHCTCRGSRTCAGRTGGCRSALLPLRRHCPRLR